jgi:Protein of unknown function (DUF742)
MGCAPVPGGFRLWSGDLIDMVTAVSEPWTDTRELAPEHRRLIDLCQTPAAVADLASQMDLPLGVVRILLGDLREKELVRVVKPPGRDTAQERAKERARRPPRALNPVPATQDHDPRHDNVGC